MFNNIALFLLSPLIVNSCRQPLLSLSSSPVPLTRNSIVSVDHPDLDDPQKETPPYAIISTRDSPLSEILSFHSFLLSRRISLTQINKHGEEEEFLATLIRAKLR